MKVDFGLNFLRTLDRSPLSLAWSEKAYAVKLLAKAFCVVLAMSSLN